jgi:two-component system NtrC family sensor kinase
MTDAYLKAYEREKKARLAAEKILDEKTREVQSSIDMIQHQFNDLMQQKKESDYFLAIAKLAKSDHGLIDIVNKYLLATVNFIEAKIGRYSYLKEAEVVASKTIGLDTDIPIFSPDFYRDIYLIQTRSTHLLESTKHDELHKLLAEQGVNRVVLLPIKCFGEVSTVCEIYLDESIDLDPGMLDQCQLAGFQIGGIIEASMNAKKLELSYLDLKSSSDQLKQAQSQLVHSEKMASLGQLSAGVAHEINNPVGFVMSNVNTLKEYAQPLQDYFTLSQQFIENPKADIAAKIKDLDDAQDLNFILKDINGLIDDSVDGLKRVKDIVANLKSFSRSDDEEYALFQLNACVEDIVKVVWNEMKYHVTLDKKLSDGLPDINGHEGQIGQVIMNILVNAAQAMKAEGNIYLKSYYDAGNVILEIKDNGKGMSQSVQDKIFDPFFTTKGVSEGTGLGLSISYGIIEKHGGNIGVKSVEGKGTCFTISLPASNEP